MAGQTSSLTNKDLNRPAAPLFIQLLDWLPKVFASVRLTVALLALLAATVLIGAWCPQESQVGQEKVIEAFGGDFGSFLIKSGVADIFHSPWFLLLIGLLTINIIVGSLKYVFPKLRLLFRPVPVLPGEKITKLPSHWLRYIPGDIGTVRELISRKLKTEHYIIAWTGNQLSADFGKFSRLAPSITHVGLITLLIGVTITAWTGFSGFKPVLVGSVLSFENCQHSYPWLGHLPNWKILVNSSSKEDYANGEAKQWRSNLTIVNSRGGKIKTQEISVNNPLSYQGVDVYQSSWGLAELKLTFNGRERTLNLEPMGKLYAAFLPLSEDSVLIFSLRDQKSPLRIFAKRPDWASPKLIAQISPGEQISLGQVIVRYLTTTAVTGLQYKSDPGLIVTYTAFVLIVLGVTLAIVPHRQLWAEIAPAGEHSQEIVLLKIGGQSPKAKVGFEQQVKRVLNELQATELPCPVISNNSLNAKEAMNV